MPFTSYSVHTHFASDSASQLLTRPVDTLLGISSAGASALADLGITTIFDLAASTIFQSAMLVCRAAGRQADDLVDHVAGDFVDMTYDTRTPGTVALAPLSAIRAIGPANAQKLGDALGVATVQELAGWPPYSVARAILNDAYGFSQPVEDIERPEDLVPIARRYATERVQYDVLVMDRVIPSPKAGTPLSHVGQAPVTQDLVMMGAIDVSDIVSAALVARPAVGAVLTYRQSWFPQGLALGHLLHSMALAPGESTRIAMVDWTRSVRGRTTEDTTQAEALAADIARTRAMSEVTQAVAHEAQSGFSGTSSVGIQNQGAQTSGSAGIDIRPQGLLDYMVAELSGSNPGGGVSIGSKGSSTATSVSQTVASSWASSSGDRKLNAEMSQNITDRTHQAANSVRNRRASTVMETSQQESEKLSTRVVTNYNHMHALTIQYFEVVQIYRVLVELSRVTRCLFVPMKLVTFTAGLIRRYKSVLAAVGLIPEVRALVYAQLNQLAVAVPNKVGAWQQRYLAEYRKATGDDAATPTGAMAFFPADGFELRAVGSWDKQVFENYDSLKVTSRQGTSYTLPLRDLDTAHNLWSPRYNVALKGVSAADIVALALVKKQGKESFAGQFDAALAFDIKLSNGTYASVQADVPAMAMVAPVAADANEKETALFAFQTTIAQADLLQHLEENALYYSTAIWRSLDAATLTTMLATYSFAGRPLIELIDPVPVSVSGNYIAFRFYGDEHGDDWQAFIQKHDLIAPQPVEDFVPLPSAGVFAEAVLGRSNAAEKLDITRFWNWQDSPIPILPPEIAPLQAGGKANDPNVKTAPLEGAVLNIVNPPNLPDPAGLGPLYSAIANGNMFRDMSGLAQTAALAQAALQAAQAGAGQATTAAGQAQQVAAQQLTDLAKIAAQLALASMTGGASGLGGAAAGAAAGASERAGGIRDLPSTPTNRGLAQAVAKDLDAKAAGGVSGSAGGPSPSRGSPTSGNEDDPATPAWARQTKTTNQEAVLHGTLPRPVPPPKPARIIVAVQSTLTRDGQSSVENFDGALLLGFSAPEKPNTSEVEKPVDVSVNASVGQVITSDLKRGVMYSVRPRLKISAGSIANSLSRLIAAARMEVPGLDLKALSNEIGARLGDPTELVGKGTLLTIPANADVLKINLTAVVKSLPQFTSSIKLDGSLGFKFDATSKGGIAFDSSAGNLGKLADKIAAIATALGQPEVGVGVEAIGALLNMFTVKLDTSASTTVDAGGGSQFSAKLDFVPSFLENIAVSVQP